MSKEFNSETTLKNMVLSVSKTAINDMPDTNCIGIARILNSYGPLYLKNGKAKIGKMVTGQYYQYHALLLAIKEVSKLINSTLTIHYHKKDYKVSDLASRILKVLNGCKKLFNDPKTTYKNIVDYSYLFIDLNGWKHNDKQLMYVAMPILKTRRKACSIARDIMDSACNYWTSMCSRTADWDSVYLQDTDGFYHKLLAYNVYNFLTKGEPW